MFDENDNAIPFATAGEEDYMATGEYYEIGEDAEYFAGEDEEYVATGLYEIGQDDFDDDDEEDEEEDEEEAAAAIMEVLASGEDDDDESYEVGRRRRGGRRGRMAFIRRRLARARRAQALARVRRRRRATRVIRRPPARIMPRVPLGGGIPVRKADPKQGRLLFLGFDSGTNIAAGATANVSTQPQDVFSPRKVIVPQTIAPNFTVNDIKVGNISQFSSSAAVPAETFVPDSAHTDVRFDTAQVSQQIVWNVTNISGAAQRFRASIEGFVLRL